MMLVLCASGAAAAELELVDVVTWPGELGGLSGIELDDTGTALTVLSDRGILQQGKIQRQAGRIATIQLSAPVQLKNRQGQNLRGTRADAEGLALGPNGTVFVSFEFLTRVVEYLPDGRPGKSLPRPQGFRALTGNRSLEALANGPGGSLLAIAEYPSETTPIYQYLDGNWRVLFHLGLNNGFVPVGADVGPDGRLYLLERKFAGIGFASRIRRMCLDGSDLVTLWETGLGLHGNLEGIAVWHDGATLRLTMVSDNNLASWQRNELVEYRLYD